MLVVCPHCRRCDHIVLGPQSYACKLCRSSWQEPRDGDRRHQILGYNPDRLRALGFRWASRDIALLDPDPFLPEPSGSVASYTPMED
jgi:hypothetical protein